MKKIVSLLAALLLLVVPFFAGSADGGVPQAVLEKTDSVFYVRSIYGSGSAFLIRKDTCSYFLTNWHVAKKDPNNILLVLNENEWVRAEVVKFRESYDLAILKVEFSVDAEPLRFAETVEKGDPAYPVGFPRASDTFSMEHITTNEHVTVTAGHVSNIYQNGQISETAKDIHTVQFDAPINGGNSGGPLLNNHGNVIGVSSASAGKYLETQNGTYSVDEQSTNGAVGVDTIRRFFEETDEAVEGQILEDIVFPCGSDGETFFLTPDEIPARAALGKLPKLWNGGDIPYLWAWIAAAIGVLFLASVVVILCVARKQRKQANGPKKRAEQPLTQYLAALSGRLTPSDAANLALPLAEALLRKHAAGELCPYLPPNAILVSAAGMKIRPDYVPGKTANPMLAAPELFTGRPYGVETDVFAFCRVLSLLRSYTVGDCAALDTMIVRGTAPLPEDRYHSMTDVIGALAPLAAEPFSDAARSPFPSGKREKKVRAGKRLVPILIASGVTVLLLTGLFFGNEALANRRIREAADAEDISGLYFWLAQKIVRDDTYRKYARLDEGFRLAAQGKSSAAVKSFEETADIHDSSRWIARCRYRLAEQAMSRQDYALAYATFLSLGDYADAKDRLSECTYRRGANLLNEANKFLENTKETTEEVLQLYQSKCDEAIKLYEDLGDYRNSSDMVLFVKFWKASDLYNNGAYADANAILIALENAGWEGAAAAREKNEKDWAIYAIEQYRNGNYEAAEAAFRALTDYTTDQKCLTVIESYLTLIEMHGKDRLTKQDVDRLRELIDFKDAADIILGDDNGLYLFLEGSWDDGHGQRVVFLNHSLIEIYDSEGNRTTSTAMTLSNGVLSYYTYVYTIKIESDGVIYLNIEDDHIRLTRVD